MGEDKIFALSHFSYKLGVIKTNIAFAISEKLDKNDYYMEKMTDETRCNNCGFLYKIEKMHCSPRLGFYYCDYCVNAVKNDEITHNFGIPVDPKQKAKQEGKLNKKKKFWFLIENNAVGLW